MGKKVAGFGVLFPVGLLSRLNLVLIFKSYFNGISAQTLKPVSQLPATA